MRWFDRLKDGLVKTRKNVQRSLVQLVGQGHAPEVLEEVEASLLGADVGVRAVARLMERLRDEVGGDSIQTLKDTLVEILASAESDPLETVVRSGPKPFVILAVGVNGVGKTTNMAKLASRFKRKGLIPLLVAADTFRAAAIEQLEFWGNRIGADVIKHRQGADPAAVACDWSASRRAPGVNVELIDTAGRPHPKVILMD